MLRGSTVTTDGESSVSGPSDELKPSMFALWCWLAADHSGLPVPKTQDTSLCQLQLIYSSLEYSNRLSVSYLN